MMKWYVFGPVGIFGFFSLFMASAALAAPGITYQGRLLKPDGTPVTSSNVQFRMQIRTPGAEDCLMYEETQTHDLSSTSGMFAITLGDGNGVRQDSYSWSLFEALSNRKDFSFNSADCIGPNTYSPDPVDSRNFRVFFKTSDMPSWEALPLQTINFIPMSIESYAVGGFTAKSLLRVEDAGTLGDVDPITTTQYDEIIDLVNGTSSLYGKPGELGGSALPSLTAGQTITSDGSGGWQAATPLTSESDPTVEAFAKASLPTCGVGEILTSDGSSLSCVTDSGGWSAQDATDTVKGIVMVPTSGGLEVSGGAIGLPDQALTPGSFTKVTVDQKGRVTSGATLVESDIPTLSTAGKVSGDAITSGTIGGTTSINSSGNIYLSGATSKVTSNYIDTRRLTLFDDQTPTPGEILLRAPATVSSNYTLTLPDSLGSANQVLGMNSAGTALENKSITAGAGVTINHTAGGIEITASGSGGTVTSVTGTTNEITVDNSDPSDPVIGLSDLAVSPAGSYGSATEVPVVTIDTKGRVTGVTETTITGVSPVGSALPNGQAWIGDGSNEAQAKFINIGDIRSSVGPGNAPFFPLTCTASQTLTWDSLADVFECEDIAIPSTQVSGLDDNYFRQGGNSFGAPAALGTMDNQILQFMTNNTAKMTILGDGRVGVGTTAPSDKLEVSGNISSVTEGGHGVIGKYVYSDLNNAPHFIGYRARGTKASPTYPQALDALMAVHGRDAIDKTHIGGMLIRAAENFSSTSKGTEISFLTTPTGTITPIGRLLITSGGDIGIGTATPSSKLDVAGTIQVADGGEACSTAADGGMIRYNGGDLQFCNGSSWQTLGISGSGLTSLNGLSDSSQTLATGSSGTAPSWSSSAGAHTLHIPMASNSGVTAGLISKSDYDTFNSKQDALGFTPLNPANNLSEIADDSAARANLGLGTAALEDVGTSAGSVVQLDGSGRIPASLIPLGAGSYWSESSGNIYRSSGFVGIGTTAANMPLTVGTEVEGYGVRIQNNSPDKWSILRLTGRNLADTNHNHADIGVHGEQGILGFRAGSSSSALLPAVDPQMVIDQTGSVGIGTTAPSRKLDVHGNAMINGLPIGSFNPYTGFAVNNQDYTHFIQEKSGTYSYSSADNGIRTSGPTWYIIRTRLPVDENATYRASLRVRKLSGDGKVYLGAVSLDENFEELSTDQATSYNYFAARGELVAVGEEKTFTGIISGYNNPSDLNHHKFDPGAQYFDLVVITNYQGTGESVVKSVEVEKLPIREAWQIPLMENGWENYSSGYSPAGYTIDNSGFVRLRGLIKNGTFGDCAFTLPEGYRPSHQALFSTITYGNAVGRVDIRTDGCVRMTAGDATWVSLDGLSFRADQ